MKKIIKLIALILALTLIGIAFTSCLKGEKGASLTDTHNDTYESDETDTEEDEEVSLDEINLMLHDVESNPDHMKVYDLLPPANTKAKVKKPYNGTCHLYTGGNQCSLGAFSVFYTFTEYAREAAVNPFEFFGKLTKTDMIEKIDCPKSYSFDYTSANLYDNYHINSSVVGLADRKYPYTRQGCDDFLRDMFLIGSMNQGTQGLEKEFLDVYRSAKAENDKFLHYSKEDDCYYAYIILDGSESSSVAFAVYFKNNDTDNITSVEFQLLETQYSAGVGAGYSLSYELSAVSEDTQILSLITSAEMLLAGKSPCLKKATEGSLLGTKFTLDEEYKVGKYTANISRASYADIGFNHLDKTLIGSANNSAHLITYKISK